MNIEQGMLNYEVDSCLRRNDKESMNDKGSENDRHRNTNHESRATIHEL